MGLLAWVVPGVAGALVMADWTPWRPTLADVPAVLLGAWGPAVLVTVATLGAVAVGAATWDPAGEGLRAYWSSTQAGRAAIDVSDLRTLGLGQAGLVLAAPIYGLPAGLGVGVWVVALPERGRVLGALLLVASLAGLGALPVAASLAVVLGAASFAVLAASLARLTPWATVAGLAAMQGLPGLGPLLAQGPPGIVGWTAWSSLALAGAAAVVVSLVPGR